jgi:hypothetical protein
VGAGLLGCKDRLRANPAILFETVGAGIDLRSLTLVSAPGPAAAIAVANIANATIDMTRLPRRIFAPKYSEVYSHLVGPATCSGVSLN